MGERGSKAEEGEGEGGYRKSGKRGRKRKKEEENVKGESISEAAARGCSTNTFIIN